jgi:cobalt-zinc-cadmium efflux system outer membrane protein
MATARKKAEFYSRSVLPVQGVVTDQTLLRYNGMFVGVFQLLEAKQDQIDAARDYILALADYWLARTELEKVLGRRIPTGELQPNSVGEPKAAPTMHHH